MSLVFFKFLLLFLWTPWIRAAPSIQKRSFKVDRVRNPNFIRHGPTELLRTYRKYRMPIPQGLLDSVGDQPEGGVVAEPVRLAAPKTPHLKQSAAAGGDAVVGLVSATPANQGIEYISPILVGRQTINVALDSGSADLWVFSSRLPALAKIGHQAYDPERSSSFKTIPGANFSITYGDGTSAAGDVGTDTVDVGGATVTGQAVQMAKAVSPAFIRDTHLSGLLGLAFSQLSTVKPVKQRTFFENVMPDLAQPLFTANLRKGTPGAFEFGRIDSTKFTGALSWIAANTSKGFWQVSTSRVTVGNGSTRFPASQAIVDTGTTLMLVSKQIFDGYYSHVPGAQRDIGGMMFPCNTTLPDLLIDVGGFYTARVSGAHVNFAKANGDRRPESFPFCRLMLTIRLLVCFGGIQRTMSAFQVWGDVFFHSQFVVFHGGNHSVGMAAHV